MVIFISLIVDLVALFVTIAVIVYAYYKWTYLYWKRRDLPYLEPKIPFGNIPNPLTSKLSSGENALLLYNEAKARGWKHCGMFMLAKPAFLIMDLDLLKHVMTKDFNNFMDRGVYSNEKNDPLSCHLFALEGQKWKNLRAKLTPTFTSGKMKMMFQTMADCGVILEKYIEEDVAEKQVAEIKEILGRFSTDIIGSCAFGLDCSSFANPNSPFRIYGKKVFEVPFFHFIRQTFALGFPNTARALGIRKFQKDVTDFFKKVVNDTVSYREKNNVTRKDFLQLLIEMKAKECDTTGDGNNLTMLEIMAQSFVFFIAGFETSSTTMTFALFEMARHPEVQDKVREEIRTVLARHNNKITYDSINELVYLKQVIDETLRMYPPVPVLTRECMNDYKLPGEDIIIEKGTIMFIPVTGIHYDKDNYENPKMFDPNRFTPENKLNRHHYAHIPFGEGPRICIGERFGVLQTKVGLTSLLKNFKISLNEKTRLPLKMDPRSLITAALGGIWLNIERA